MKIEIVHTDADQPWHARLVGDNGEIVWTTENYTTSAHAYHAIELLGGMFGFGGKMTIPAGRGTVTFATADRLVHRSFDVRIVDESGAAL